MPLSPLTVDRTRLHTRRVSFEVFQRSDGLFDIEAHLTDIKDHDYALLTGVRKAGEGVHDMWARVTIDGDYLIRSIEVKTDEMPYPAACDLIEPAYARLVGANLLKGFLKTVNDTMGGIKGCSHIIEMLAQMPTAAIQMFAGLHSAIVAD